MTKKNIGKFLILTAISTAIAAGVSYFLKYRSFHAELDEDFHDFEGDDDSFGETSSHEAEMHRNYVPLGEKKENPSLKEMSEDIKEAGTEAMEAAAQKAEDVAVQAKETASQTAQEVKETLADVAEKTEEAMKDMATTVIEEDMI